MAHPRRPIAKTSDGVTVATTSTVVLADNPSRLYVRITNSGTTEVWLKLATSATAPTAVLNKGIYLAASGGTWESTSYSGPIAGIAKTSSDIVGVTEI